MTPKVEKTKCTIGDCPDLQQNATYPWCAKHLARFRRHGDPLITKTPRARTSTDGTMRECCRCEEWKPLADFYPDSGTGRGKRSACKACIQADARAKYREDPVRPAANRRRHVLRQFGISLEVYEAILETQGGGCAICGERCPTGRVLAVDHDHITGVVRGLLCAPCNLSLPRAEIPGWLDAARAYLDRRTDLRIAG
jgi:hypothetical protein